MVCHAFTLKTTCSCLEARTGRRLSSFPSLPPPNHNDYSCQRFGYNRTIKLWDLRTMRSRDTLMGHTDAVYCLYYHNNRLISGGEDRTARVTDAAVALLICACRNPVSLSDICRSGTWSWVVAWPLFRMRIVWTGTQVPYIVCSLMTDGSSQAPLTTPSRYVPASHSSILTNTSLSLIDQCAQSSCSCGTWIPLSASTRSARSQAKLISTPPPCDKCSSMILRWYRLAHRLSP